MTDREQSDISSIAKTIDILSINYSGLSTKIDNVLLSQGAQGEAIATIKNTVNEHTTQLSTLILNQHDQGKYIDGQIQQKVTEASISAGVSQAKLGASYSAKFTFAYSLLSTAIVVFGLFFINKIFHLNLSLN